MIMTIRIDSINSHYISIGLMIITGTEFSLVFWGEIYHVL